MHPDSARELKARILAQLPSAPVAASDAGTDAPWPWVAVGLTPVGGAAARVAVRLQREGDRALLPDLGAAAAAEVDVRVIGPVRALGSPTPADLQVRVRPLRPGLSVAHPAVSAGTLGGFVRSGGGEADRVATLTAFERFREGLPNLVDAAVAVLDAGVGSEPGNLPGGPLGAEVVAADEIDPDDTVEKVGRTTGHTRGVVTAVEVDAVAVQYDDVVHRFDDQLEIQGLTGGFSAGGDSGSVIWRSRDRAPMALLFAGSATGGVRGTGVTFANPLATVLRLLDVEWWNGTLSPTSG